MHTLIRQKVMVLTERNRWEFGVVKIKGHMRLVERQGSLSVIKSSDLSHDNKVMSLYE